MNVISTTTPDPFFSEVLWPLGLRASTGGELTVSATSRNAVNNSGRGHSVSKSGLLWGWNEEKLKNVWPGGTRFDNFQIRKQVGITLNEWNITQKASL